MNPSPPSPLSAYRRYRKEFDRSYTLGASPTVELLRCRPAQARRVLIRAAFRPKDGTLFDLCEKTGVPYEYNDRLVERLSPKDSCLVIGIFDKFTSKLSDDGNHIVLVNPSDMGNLGTVLRTAVGFGLPDVAVIRPGADCFDPKAVRASMGALFRAKVEYFDRFADYTARFPRHNLYPFLLSNRAEPLPEILPKRPYALIFGNESSGLDPGFAQVGTPVIIPHTKNIDSLNLSMAAGIGMYHFTTHTSKE